MFLVKHGGYHPDYIHDLPVSVLPGLVEHVTQLCAQEKMERAWTAFAAACAPHQKDPKKFFSGYTKQWESASKSVKGETKKFNSVKDVMRMLRGGR